MYSRTLKGNGNSNCTTTESIGCIYQELLDEQHSDLSPIQRSDNAKTEKFSIQLSPTSNIAEKIDIEVCVQGCKSFFPYDSFSHFGVRWDEMNANIECWCLMSETFDSSMIGPQVKSLTLIYTYFSPKPYI